MSKRINILITCSSGKFIFDVVKALKSLDNFKIKIIGVNSNPKTNLAYLDKQYKISKCNSSKNYFKNYLKYAKKKILKLFFHYQNLKLFYIQKN